MAANTRGIILRSDELKGQLDRFDKKGNEGDRSFMMSCWSGLERYTEDRITRDSNLNIPLALTWVGGIPPNALQRYLREAIGHGSGADGFMQRLQLVCFPDQCKTFELANNTVPKELQEQMESLFLALDSDAISCERELHFSEQAQERFDEWLVNSENDARSGGHPVYWESHLGKQSKVVGAIVIILHRLREILCGFRNDEVCMDILEAALTLRAYYEAHAKRCYECVSGFTINDAETIINMIKKRRLPERFKAQDIYHNGLCGLSDSARVKEALEFLQGYHWVVSEKVSGLPKGRQHEFWNVHPDVFRRS